MPGIGGGVSLPKRFPKRLLFSVDTEPDDELWQGLGEGSWTHDNLRGIPELQRRLNALGIRPTYLVSHSIAEKGSLEKVLDKDLSAGVCEIGTHFHPGDTPPFPDPGNERKGKQGRSDGDNILLVPSNLLEEKFSHLHEMICTRFGKPTSHRAGAWALDGRLTGLLKSYGYLVDSSVTPGISWIRNKRPSYLAAPMEAYYLGEGNDGISERGESGIVEIPVSIWSRHKWKGTLAGALFGDVLTMPLSARGGVAARIVKAIRPDPPRWLRPAFCTVAEMEFTAERLEADGSEYLHVMCHSNELWPGASPYCKTSEQLDRYYGRFEGIFKFALGRGYLPVTLSEYAGEFAQAHAAKSAGVSA